MSIVQTSLLFSSVNYCADIAWTWSSRLNHIASEERSYLKGWHLLLPLPSVEPSIESCQSLGVGDEQAAEENVHLDPQKERPFLKLREGLLKHQQDDDDDDDAEGEDEVEAGEGDEVGDGGP